MFHRHDSYYSIIRQDSQEIYQNGDPVQSGVQELPIIHATRPEFISRIMREGVHATTKSHHAIGLWCHLQTPESEKWSHDWGRTPLDVFSGCYIGVRTPEDGFELKTGKNSLGGKGDRVLVKGTAGSPDMPVRIVSVTFRIPSSALGAWRKKLRICVAQCILNILKHVEAL